eukprot:scaffold146874_cov36-Prasinocladus_malaysianus.AAC.1
MLRKASSRCVSTPSTSTFKQAVMVLLNSSCSGSQVTFARQRQHKIAAITTEDHDNGKQYSSGTGKSNRDNYSCRSKRFYRKHNLDHSLKSAAQE